jgi:hypothetical protein
VVLERKSMQWTRPFGATSGGRPGSSHGDCAAPDSSFSGRGPLIPFEHGETVAVRIGEIHRDLDGPTLENLFDLRRMAAATEQHELACRRLSDVELPRFPPSRYICRPEAWSRNGVVEPVREVRLHVPPEDVIAGLARLSHDVAADALRWNVLFVRRRSATDWTVIEVVSTDHFSVGKPRDLVLVVGLSKWPDRRPIREVDSHRDRLHRVDPCFRDRRDGGRRR